jgi:hypothetical protein
MKATKTFVYSLVAVLMLVLAGLALKFFGLWDVGDTLSAVVLMVLGVGFFIEGTPRMILKMTKNGLNGNEVSHMASIVIGFLAFISGFLQLPFVGLSSTGLNVLSGVVVVIALALVPIELLVVD